MGDIKVMGVNIEASLPLVGFSLWNLIVFLLVIVIGVAVVKLIARLIYKSLRKMQVDEILAGFLTRILKVVMFIFVFGAALGVLGIQIGYALVSIAVVLGFVLGFALGDTLSNIAAGFMISITKPFKKGDYVEVSGQAGVIKAVGVSTTELDTPDNKRVIVPNKLVWGSNIVNYTRHNSRRVDMEVGVGYGEDLNKVIATTMNVITSHKKVLKDPAPQVAVKEMGDSAVVFVVRPWCKTADYWDVFFDLQKGLKEGYVAAGIEIPFPQMDVHLSKEQ